MSVDGLIEMLGIPEDRQEEWMRALSAWCRSSPVGPYGFAVRGILLWRWMQLQPVLWPLPDDIFDPSGWLAL